MTTAKLVTYWRKKRGYTQVELAKRSGVSGPYISQIEAGKRKMAFEKATMLAAALHVRVDRLVGE